MRPLLLLFGLIISGVLTIHGIVHTCGLPTRRNGSAFFFWHFHKTGGTSINELLKDLSQQYHLYVVTSETKFDSLLQNISLFPDQKVMKSITFFRDPIERIISN